MTNSFDPRIVLNDEVATALIEGRGVVALETTIVVQGLPAPVNLEVAKQCEDAVRATGSVPATIGILDGEVVVGLTIDQLEELASPKRNAAKLSARDLGLALARGVDGATTVAGTIAVANRVGIDVMATGGLGGVHRDAIHTYDESADLTALSRTSVLVVASGVKSILDIGATLERLDTLGVPVAGFKTSTFPGFYLRDSGFELDWSLDDVNQAARAFLEHRHFSNTGLLVANPVDADRQLARELHDEALERALAKARELGVTGKEVTPVLLAEFADFTHGRSVEVNKDLVVSNSRVAGEIATEFARIRA